MSVIRKPKAHFARYGIPEQLVTDNGPQFASCYFLKFEKEWDFEHLTSSPHHSQSNGKAESAVKEAKKLLRKYKLSGSDAFFALLDHRNTPTTGVSNQSSTAPFQQKNEGSSAYDRQFACTTGDIRQRVLQSQAKAAQRATSLLLQQGCF